MERRGIDDLHYYIRLQEYAPNATLKQMTSHCAEYVYATSETIHKSNHLLNRSGLLFSGANHAWIVNGKPSLNSILYSGTMLATFAKKRKGNDDT